MSFGQDYKDRNRRRRRQDIGVLFYVLKTALTTAALVAIAFAFDVPKLLRAKFWGAPPPAVAKAEPERHLIAPSEKPIEQPATNDAPQPEEFDDPPRRAFDPPVRTKQQAPRQDKIVLPKRSRQRAADVPQNPPPAVPAADDPARQTLVLDLDKRQMRIAVADMADSGEPTLRVIGLRRTETPVEMKPTDGAIVDSLEIRFPKHPRARILVSTDRVGERFFLLVEPQMALWAEEPMPFMRKRIKSEAFKTRREGDDFVATLAADKERRVGLGHWLKTGRVIPLDEFKRGKSEYQNLGESIKEREARVGAVRQSVTEVVALEELANQLHGRAELEFEVVSPD